MKLKNKVMISERALIQRINRKLKKDHKILRQCKQSSRSYYQLGDFYIVDFYSNGISRMDVGIEDLGRKLGVLSDFEALEGRA